MQGVLISLQLAVLIPLIVVVLYKPVLNLFFKILFASLILSLIFDIIGTACFKLDIKNLVVYCVYLITNSILVTFLWQKVPFYNNKYKTFVRTIGIVAVVIMLITVTTLNFSRDAFYITSCLNVLLGLIFALQYYYQKLKFTTYTPLLDDPYFITASGIILFCLSTIVILAAQIQLRGQPGIFYTWMFRQLFYLIYNIIIAYAFYVLHQTQVKGK